MGDRSLFKRSFASRSARSGFTIVEVLTVISVFGILVTAIFSIFNMGLSAFHKTTTKNELLQEAQITNVKLSADLERSTLSSLSCDASDPEQGIAAFLTALDDDEKFITDNRGRPVWQKYLVYYLDDSTNEMYRREVPVLPTAPQRTVPTPIEFYNGGGGPATLLSYRNGGRAISRFIQKFEPDELPAPVSQLTWRLTLERERYGSERPESLTTNVAIRLRN